MIKSLVLALAAAMLLPLAGCLGGKTNSHYSDAGGYGQPYYGPAPSGYPANPYPGGGYPPTPGAPVYTPDRVHSNAPANVDTRGWLLLGRVDVRVEPDTETIRVNPNQGFRRLMLTVDGANIAMEKFRITFADGSTFDPKVEATLNEGNRAVVIDLPGRVQALRAVSFRPRSSKIAGGRSMVSLYGQ